MFKRNLSTILLVVVMLLGLCLLLYPTVSDYWNSLHQSRAVASYQDAVAQIDNSHYEELLAGAQEYNRELYLREGSTWAPSEEEYALYSDVLDVSGTGIMCSIEIPKIKVNLPIYHGTDEGVLQIAVGHVVGSSLPIGGENTHTVLSGHRGLPSARLFTDLDRLLVGDTFLIRVLDEVLTYEVDQILIVEPTDFSALGREPGEDLCTLVTCTPYGVNSHRMLVRGHRVETQKEKRIIRVSADAVQIEPIQVAPVVAAPILLLLMLIVLCTGRRKKG